MVIVHHTAVRRDMLCALVVSFNSVCFFCFSFMGHANIFSCRFLSRVKFVHHIIPESIVRFFSDEKGGYVCRRFLLYGHCSPYSGETRRAV